MERTATWANIGSDFIPGVTKIVDGLPEEMAFSVSKVPMGFINAAGNFQQVKGTSTIVNDVTGHAYGPVSDNYAAVSNKEALGVLQDVERMGMQIVKYGDTHTGMQFIIGRLDDVKILGDAFTPYLVFRNSFNGRYPIQVAITPLRIVCQNQLNWAFKNAENTINIKHSSRAQERLEQAQRIMLSTADYMKALTAEAEKYATMKISPAQENMIISQLFPITDNMTDRQKDAVQQKLAQYQVARLANDTANFKGTAWQLVQTYTDFLTHQQPVRVTTTAEENKFMAITFDPKIMQKFFSVLNSVAA